MKTETKDLLIEAVEALDELLNNHIDVVDTDTARAYSLANHAYIGIQQAIESEN